MVNPRPMPRARKAPDDIKDWMRQRSEDLRNFGAHAETAGREAWDNATRAGQDLTAKTSADLVALGARILQKQPALSPQAPHRGSNRAQPSPREPFAQDAGDQFMAGVGGAADSLPFGVADKGSSVVKALIDNRSRGADLAEAYHRHMEAERARDRFDAAHYRTARTIGQVVGTGAQIAALGPAEGLFAGGVRAAEATPLIAREVGVLGGVGATGGMAGQYASDRANHRTGTLGDYLGAGLGGVVGAVGSRSGNAGLAGAADGAATSIAQDLFNGRAPSIEQARRAAQYGGEFGVVGGLAGRGLSGALPNNLKGSLGEQFSRLRTMARGDTTVMGSKTRTYLKGGGYTVPDQRTVRGIFGRGAAPQDIVESKFGQQAHLSSRQRQAYREGLPGYRVDSTTPGDVGAVLGFPLAQYGVQEPLGGWN